MTENNTELMQNNSSDQTIDTENLTDSQIRNVLTPGTILRARREQTNAELAVIARELNLDTWMLTALEEDDFEKFGAEVFAKGHLKHYAEHLGLNPDDVLFAYYQVAERKETTPVIKRNISSTSQKKNYVSIVKWISRLVMFLVIAGLAYAAYVFASKWLDDSKQDSQGTTEINLAPQNAANDQASLGTIALPNNSINYATDSNASAETTQAGNPQSQSEAKPIVNQVDAGQNSDATSSTPAVNKSNILRFEFTQSSWVEVFDADNKQLIYDNKRPGTVQEITISGPTSIFFGNYPGVKLSFNGSTYAIPNSAKAGNTARFVLEP